MTDEQKKMASEWWLTLESMAMGKPVLGTSELVRRGYAVFEHDGGYWRATRAGLIALGGWLAAGGACGTVRTGLVYGDDGSKVERMVVDSPASVMLAVARVMVAPAYRRLAIDLVKATVRAERMGGGTADHYAWPQLRDAASSARKHMEASEASDDAIEAAAVLFVVGWCASALAADGVES